MRSLYVILIYLAFSFSCSENKTVKIIKEEIQLRPIHDTIGFAQYNWQMDSIYKRLHIMDRPNTLEWKAVISPHDDYKYAGRLYYESLKGINASTIILIGVAHRARNFELQDQIIFGNHTDWKSPYGTLKVSSLNTQIIKNLKKTSYIVHDSMQELEHSLEAIIPFLHRKNRAVEIVPILIPYINFKTIDAISSDLAVVVHSILEERQLKFGKDVAIVISNDAVHYGNLDWGGSNLAPYGIDKQGTEKARQHDLDLIKASLIDDISMDKVKHFTEITVKQEDYKTYKWVWCGRYSVPFGLAFANKLNIAINKISLKGSLITYESSIDHDLITVEDIGMGSTAIANQNHWVAYVSLKYE